MAAAFQPACLSLGADELRRRADVLYGRGRCCDWCPRRCKVNRTGGEHGACGAGAGVVVASANLHFGEEAHFTGTGGSGTVFFSGCNLGCVFCQNHDISHRLCGRQVDAAGLAAIFMQLQRRGAENLNLVTPSHYPADILAALAFAVDQGFALPVVWNSGGYDAVDTLELYDGVVDIYMPDFKFATDETGARLTRAADYATVAKAALAGMVRQTGPGLRLAGGVAQRGMSVRHLVMPGHCADSRACLDYLHSLSPEITVNIMSQYRPAARATAIPGLNRFVDIEEYSRVVAYGRSIGLKHVLAQA